MVHLLAICILTSAAASTQTTILPTARTALSMAVFKAIPERFADIHPKYLTPTSATVWMGGVSIVFYVALTKISQDILGDTIAAVGLMIAFYYGLTGFACVWFYRHTMWAKPRDIVMQGLIPFLGGLILLGAFIVAAKSYFAPDYGHTSIGGVGGVFILGVGSLALGALLMVVWNAINPEYFSGATLPRRSAADLVLVGGGGRPVGIRLPDSLERTVIASDLSNLPPGGTAIDPHTGVEITRPSLSQTPPPDSGG